MILQVDVTVLCGIEIILFIAAKWLCCC